MNSRPLRVLAMLAGLIMLCSLTLMTGPAALARVDSAPAAEVAGADPLEKIHPNLLAEVRAARSGTGLAFVARIRPGADLAPYAEEWFARPFVDPLGRTVAVGSATPAGILKMAMMADVFSLQRPESLVAVPEPVDPDVDASLNLAARPSLARASANAGPAPEGWYHTGGAIHGSQAAWAKGYTGEGVKYMINDSGADYCHPDLLGTWAYDETPGSPYYGLPMMFDSRSSYLAAVDYYLGQDNIAAGTRRSQWADTSATAGGDFNYQPLGAAEAHDYTVPGTSLSGEYHYGSHPDSSLADGADLLSAFFGDATAVRGERAAILVVDEHTAGVYDTVYVDLNYNYDFSDDTPARLGGFSGKEAACLDYTGDGLNDISGGLVYFISDGETAVPTLDWLWGIPGSNYGNGDLVAFHVMDYLASPGGNHGMGCTSVAVGQGVVRGSLVFGPDGNPIAGNRGLVVGPGKDVKTTQSGDYYIAPFIEDAYLYAGLGYDGVQGTADDIQIVSNSWGFSDIDNDGFDQDSRLIDLINRVVAPNTTLLFSTGNGAAGYGTNSPPSPPSAIGVGASTLYGTTGEFEAIVSPGQILGGDPMSWSNRGPGADGSTGVDIVATGAFGTGSIELNAVFDGSVATGSFGGTSMAGPVAAGNLALIYQAWKERTGAWPTFDQATELLMSSATRTGHDVWTQGAGLVNADVGTDVAAGRGGVYATPSAWRVGDYRGEEYPAFAHIIAPGAGDTQKITLHNPGNQPARVKLRAEYLRQIGKRNYSFRSLDQSLSHGEFTTPDYAFRIDQDIPRGTEMLQVRLQKPYLQFDPDDDQNEPFNNWRIHLQNWTDLNGDGRFWDDLDGDGKVGPAASGEMQTGEHNRFTYGYNFGPGQQARVGYPRERIDDGLLLTLRHRDRLQSVPRTDLLIEASYWRHSTWSWVSLDRDAVVIPAGGSAEVWATFHTPQTTSYGMYQGAIIATYGPAEACGHAHDAIADGRCRDKDEVSHELTIPVTAAVAAAGPNFRFGLGLPSKLPYDNTRMFGYTDYGWRAESGDWRFFWADIAARDLPTRGKPYLVVDTRWRNHGTDIDTVILGPSADVPNNIVEDGSFPQEIYGPYTLGEVGRSANTYLGSGRWSFQTSSGGPREIVSAPLTEGLYEIMLHQVKVDGRTLDDNFSGRVGVVTVEPGIITASGDGSATISIASSIPLSSFTARGFGLSTPTVETALANQDDPDDPLSASVVREVTISNGARLDVSTAGPAGTDLDLFVYDPAGDLVGASTTPTADESVVLTFPRDGTYTIRVLGWSVPDPDTPFTLTINAVQGFDVTAGDLPEAIPAGGSGTLTLRWSAAGKAPGTYEGLLLMGPAAAPGLFEVPLEIVVP